jgi:membrane-bound ClpP family serine protease
MDQKTIVVTSVLGAVFLILGLLAALANNDAWRSGIFAVVLVIVGAGLRIEAAITGTRRSGGVK